MISLLLFGFVCLVRLFALIDLLLVELIGLFVLIVSLVIQSIVLIYCCYAISLLLKFSF